jgi:hypothetical protein
VVYTWNILFIFASYTKHILNICKHKGGQLMLLFSCLNALHASLSRARLGRLPKPSSQRLSPPFLLPFATEGSRQVNPVRPAAVGSLLMVSSWSMCLVTMGGGGLAAGGAVVSGSTWSSYGEEARWLVEKGLPGLPHLGSMR